MSSDLSYPSCVDRTNAFLKQDKIIIAESAHVIDNFFIRVDLLVKTGSLIEIYEVKSININQLIKQSSISRLSEQYFHR